MKIILRDNHAREDVADQLVYENLHPWIANWMVEEMQRGLNDYSNWYPDVVFDEYRLWRGMEDLV